MNVTSLLMFCSINCNTPDQRQLFDLHFQGHICGDEQCRVQLGLTSLVTIAYWSQ